MKLIAAVIAAVVVSYVVAMRMGKDPSEKIRRIADQAAAKTHDMGESITRARETVMEAAADKVEAMAGKAAETLRGQHPEPG